MSAEGLIELFGALVSVVGLVLLAGKGLPARRSSEGILAGLLGLLLVVHLSEGLEWLGFERASRIGETLAILVPAMWVFLLFTMRSQELTKEAFTSESQLGSVLDDAPVPLAILSQSGEYLATSASWRELFDPASFGCTTLEDCPAARDFIDEVMEGIRSESGQDLEPIELRLGERREWVIWSASPYHTAPGTVGGHVVVLNVLTESVEADAEARALQADLERVNRSDLVGLLASGVAHDVRNFLMVVQAHVDLLQDGGGSIRDAKESIAAIHDAVDLSTRVLQTLTNLSRKELPAPQPLDLVDLVRRADRLLRRCLPSGTSLLIELPERPVLVSGTAVRLQQVLLNLVTNARDAMPEGGSITLRLWEEEDRAIVEVGDTGHGMSEALRERIFENLFTTKELGLGTGLGLSIVSNIVQEHDGEIQVESAPGQGARFRISLPLLALQGQSLRTGT